MRLYHGGMSIFEVNMKNIKKFLADKRGDMNMVNAGILLVMLLVVPYVGSTTIEHV